MIDGYTITELDAAILAIAGEAAINAVQHGRPRPHAMLNAAQQAWIDQRPEDEHTRALRAGLADLNTKGGLLPRDGVWPV